VQGGAAANYAGNFRDATVGGSCYMQITTNASGSANTDGLVWGLDTASPPNGYLSLKENATLYLQANSATVGAFSSTGLAVTGALSVSNGIEQYKNANSTSYIRVANDSTGAAADSYFYAQNSATTLFMGLPSTGFTTSGLKVAGQAYIYHDGAGGLNIGATNGAGAVRMYAGGTTKVGEWTGTGLAVTGTGGGAYVGQFTNSNSTSYGIYVAAGGGGSRQIAYFADYNGAVTMNVQSGSVAVTGQLSGNNAIFGIRNNITSTDRISVTGATTIFSIATGGSSVGASGAVLLVNGYNTASSTNSFIDLVLFIGSNTPTVLGSVNRGSPAARTYTASGSNLQLAMASGTYNVASSSTEQAC
jgi:hypothetical protein